MTTESRGFSTAGFLTFDEMIERYGRRVDVPHADMRFYLGLAHFKLAGIVESIHFRHVNGHTAGGGFDTVGELTEPLLRAGVAAMRKA
jgi:aminoglycoside phosphotransferase (APT) family kinase protein